MTELIKVTQLPITENDWSRIEEWAICVFASAPIVRQGGMRPMAWFEAHDTMARHPKTLKLARLLGVDRRYAVGLLHDLFSWGLTAARKDGKLQGLEAGDIASALDAPPGKKGQALVEALVGAGYLEILDGAYYIHDWYDYAGKLMDKREADRKRKAGYSKNPVCIPTEFQRKSSGNPLEAPPDVLRNSTRNRT